jgi:gatB/yqey domain protein
MINVDELISNARKEGNKIALKTLQLIKSEFSKVEHSGTKLDNVEQLKILKRMKNQYEQAVEEFKKGGREDLVGEEEQELELICSLLPEQVDESVVTKYIDELCNELGDKLSMRDIKPILTKVQEKYPMVDGKLVSNIIKDHLRN